MVREESVCGVRKGRKSMALPHKNLGRVQILDPFGLKDPQVTA